MTREDIIRLAQEAGFQILLPSDHVDGTGGVYVGDDEIAAMLECFANLVAARLLREQHAEIERLRGALKSIETLKVTIGGRPASGYQTEGWMRELAREALEESNAPNC